MKYLTAFIIITGLILTLATSVLSASKLRNLFNSTASIASSSLPSSIPTVSPVGPTDTINTPTLPPTTAPAPSTAAKSSPTANGCLITVNGQTYDVAPLRRSHPGGDIFVCNTDMTAVYNKQHGTGLDRLKPYLVTGSFSSVSVSASGGSSAEAKVESRIETKNYREEWEVEDDD